jgi:ABC-type glycerol-3-phosphate transport system substrate-binding protein
MKKRTFPKKAAVLLLAAAMFLPLAACSQQDDPKDTAAPSGPASGPAETDAPANITDQRFPGERFNIAYMTGGSYGMGNEVFYSPEESETTRVSSAVCERNRLTEERLGIAIRGMFIAPAIFNDAVIEMVYAGDDTYDTVLNYLRHNYQLASQGVLLNVKRIDGFRLENPWWDRGIIDNFSFFGDTLFFVTGDICIDDDCTTEVVLVNKKLAADFGLEDPYLVVREGRWTLDALTRNMAKATSDLNGDGVMDKHDRYGFCGGVGEIPAMMVCMGAPSTVIDAEGCPRFAFPLMPEKMNDTFEALYNGLVINKDVVFIEVDMGGDYAGVAKMFANNQLLYYLCAVGSLHNLRGTMEDDFGVLPYPKLNEEQENYIANGGWCASTYAVPKTSADPERTGAILNVMSYYSVENITEYIIQSQVIVRTVRDRESEEMLRTALAHKTYDIGLCLSFADYNVVLQAIPRSRNLTFASDMASIQEKFEKKI